MRRRRSEQIGDLVRQYLRDEGLETPLNQHRLISSWGDVMGKGIYNYTGDVFIKNQTLYVKIHSSVLRQELTTGRKNIVKRLNEHVGAQVITDIRFY
jgi:predicted nucleic acid-binding Zn ribbon protein